MSETVRVSFEFFPPTFGPSRSAWRPCSPNSSPWPGPGSSIRRGEDIARQSGIVTVEMMTTLAFHDVHRLGIELGAQRVAFVFAINAQHRYAADPVHFGHGRRTGCIVRHPAAHVKFE